MSTIIRGGIIVTGDPGEDILRGYSILVEGNRIASVFPGEAPAEAAGAETVDATGHVVIPGFIQTHVHLCQTLFRGMADDLPLLEWLRKKIFPLEAAHDDASIRISALLGIAELLRGGTTTILDMGSIHGQEEIIGAIAQTGLRACAGKAMMDVNDIAPGFRESTAAALRSTRDLAERWHGSYGDRIRYAVAPRFVLSCSDTLMKDAFEMASHSDGMLFHTHASEHPDELRAVRERCGMENIRYLHHLGLLSDRTCLAHCVHVTGEEISILGSTGASVAHCPSSNLKLGSGVAGVPEFLDNNINVSLGADGAPCNNSLNMFLEMRLAGLMQRAKHGAAVLPAKTLFRMATLNGAAALGLDTQIGSIEKGKKVDLVLLNLDRLWNPVLPESDLYSAIVFSGGPENVESVMVDGRWLYRKGEYLTLDEAVVVRDAKIELQHLLNRL